MTEDQIREIPWATLVPKLVGLRGPLAHWLEMVREPPHLRDDEMVVILTDILSTLDYIGAVWTPMEEVKGDATTS